MTTSSSSSAFSFHCMICFEEFDPTNYPVVLPCGHTYVCVNCAKRIDKCMECRAPLIVAPPPPPPPVSTSPSRSYNSYGYGYSPRPQRQRPQPWWMREAEAADQRQRERERQQQQQQPQQQQQQQQPQQQQQTQQQQSSIKKKHRLPLPKNVVLLSLIQASEPARRRTTLLAAAEMTTEGSVAAAAAAVDTETKDVKQQSTAAAESPQKQAVTDSTEEEEDDDALLESPPSARSSRHSQSKNIITLPDVSSSLSRSPLLPFLTAPTATTATTTSSNNVANFINNNEEENDDSSNNTEKQEDLKIQMGIGACTGVSGTYAVIDKNGILVFRTLVDLDLFEKRRRKRMMVGVGSKEEGEQGRMQEEEGGGVVEGERGQLKQEQQQMQEEEDVNVEDEDDDKSVATAIVSKLSRVFHSLLSFDDTVDGSGSDDSNDHNDGTTVAATPGEGGGGAFPVVDQQKPSDSLGLTLSTSTSNTNALAAGNDCQDDGTNSNNNNTMMNELDTASSGGLYGSDILSLHEKPSLSFGLSSVASSTICHGSWDVNQSVNSPKKTYSIAVETDRTRSLTETGISVQDGRQHPSESEDKKINRQGGDGSGNDKSEGEEGNAPPPPSVAVAPSMQEDEDSTFEGSYIRLKYGDRVQVVSFDPRGWVKLARGYGYICLQNDKQLVKVGGPNDKACHIESTLHELSIERDRLKREQIKLERLSAGLMIDLQSTLLTTSDDHVICSPPKGFLRMSDSDSCGEDTNDGIVVTSTRFKSDGGVAVEIGGEAVEITTTPTSSPRKDTTNQVQTDRSLSPNTRITPTREVNWRTGMSGHMALSSPFTSSSATTYSHPHDFIAATSGGTTRSMSNHSGASTPKSKSRKQPRASIY